VKTASWLRNIHRKSRIISSINFCCKKICFMKTTNNSSVKINPSLSVKQPICDRQV
jgi:hypothetical protein